MRIISRINETAIISIWIIICGILLLILGIQGIDRGLFRSCLIDMFGLPCPPPEPDDWVILITYSLFVALGIGYLLVVYGLMRRKKMLWSITRILVSLGVIIGSISIIFELIFAFIVSEPEIPVGSFVRNNVGNLLVLGLSAIIFYFVYRPNVISDNRIENSMHNFEGSLKNMRTYQTLALIGCILGILLMGGLWIYINVVLGLFNSDEIAETMTDREIQESLRQTTIFSAGTLFSIALYIVCLVVTFVVRTKTVIIGIILLVLGIISVAITNYWGIVPFVLLLPAGIMALRSKS